MDQLYLGGKVEAKSLSTLRHRNVLRILNVTPAKEVGIKAGVPNYFENTKDSKIKYKRIPVYDAATSDLLSHADEMVQFISNGLHHGSVLVHCQRGVSRSATAVIMFLMRKANMTASQSLALCQQRRPVTDPIPAFLDQLRAYEKECRLWGHLTAVDETQKANGKGTFEDNDVKKSSQKDGFVSSTTTTSSFGGKRKFGNSSVKYGEKKRIAAPIGPRRGPSVKFPAIGLTMGPSTKISSKGSNFVQSNDDGCKGEDIDGKGTDGERVKKRVVGPTNRPPF